MKYLVWSVNLLGFAAFLAGSALLLAGGYSGQQTFKHIVKINRQAWEIDDWFVEPDRIAQWRSDIAYCKWTTGGDVAVGSTYSETSAGSEVPVVYTTEVVDWANEVALTTRTQQGDVVVENQYELENRGSRTRVVFVRKLSYQGFLPKLLSPLTRTESEAQFEQDVTQLKYLIEKE
jgi:hypothetical protein